MYVNIYTHIYTCFSVYSNICIYMYIGIYIKIELCKKNRTPVQNVLRDAGMAKKEVLLPLLYNSVSVITIKF